MINVPYGLITNTKLLYRASPDSSLLEGTSEIVNLATFSRFNPAISGNTAVEVSVDEDEEEIEIIVSSGEKFVYPQRTGGGTLTDITVQVVKEGEPVSGFPLELAVHPVPNSGGHDHHDENCPAGTLEHATGETDENGIFTSVFTSSEIGGIEWVIASNPESSSKDSVLIRIEVPGLHNLSEISSDAWRLTGNSGSTSYSKCSGDPILHPENHFARQELIDRLQIAVAQFFQWTKMTEDVGEHLTVGVNDISLPKGGLFDICSDWEPAHSSHRNGIDVDIDSRVFVFGTNQNLNLRDDKYRFILDKLVDLMEQNRLFWKPSEGFHFRVE